MVSISDTVTVLDHFNQDEFHSLWPREENSGTVKFIYLSVVPVLSVSVHLS